MLFAPVQLGLIAFITVMGLAVAYWLQISLGLGFILGLFALVFFTLRAGIGARTILHSMMKGIKHTKEVMWILVLVGLLIPSWTASGTIPYLIDTGLSVLNPSYFLTLSFLFAAIISMVLGTSSGTLSSVGIPLIGVGAVLQIPLPLLAGALVSGAFVGDRTSPFSSAHQLVAASTGTTVRKQFTSMLPTTLGAAALATVYFYVFDLNGEWHERHDAIVTGEHYAAGYSYSLWLLLPVLILLGSILFRVKTRYGFLLSIAAGIALGSAMQGISLPEWLEYLWSGYDSSFFTSLHTKGLSSMVDLIILIGLAGAYNGILEETGVLQPYMLKIMGESPTLFSATVRAACFGLGLGLVSCTQTLPIMMTGRNLLPFWEVRFHREQLSRVVADTSLVFAAMIPWNMLAILCGAIIGVPVGQYVAFAPFLWSLPLLTVGMSCLAGKKGEVRSV